MAARAMSPRRVFLAGVAAGFAVAWASLILTLLLAFLLPDPARR